MLLALCLPARARKCLFADGSIRVAGLICQVRGGKANYFFFTFSTPSWFALAVWRFQSMCMSVKIDKIREALHTQPFQPFWIYMADGGKIPVEHEDFVALGPTGREMIVFLGDNTHQVVDVAMVTRLAMRSRNGLRTRKKS